MKFTMPRLTTLRNLMLLFITVLLFSCSKTSSGPNGGSSSITAFSFQVANNAVPLESDAAINGNSISIFLPPGTNVNALKATYTLSDSGIVRVNGVQQQSGVTTNNFSSPVNYTVTGTSGNAVNYTVTVTTGIDAIDQGVAAFMSTYNVPGMSLAITLNDHLVYANSYGKGNTETGENINNNSLFRVASLSKQITSAAIMRLLDENKLNLQQTVFGTNGILGVAYGSQPYGPGIENITIDNLLHHTEGGWPDDGTDPTGQNLSQTASQMISWGLNNVPLLDATPGDSYNYSHFGYIILGRIIEKITGLPYQQAVQQLVLQPSGITDMSIGGNTATDRLPNEVTYYATMGDPYYLPIARMDAANGWVASATDMARFMAHVDGLSQNTILSPNAVNTMFTPSLANKKYACGWNTNGTNVWHDGSWPGTGTTQGITTQNGNFNYVILCNSSSSNANFKNDLGNVFWNALPNVANWPTYDLFGSK